MEFTTNSPAALTHTASLNQIQDNLYDSRNLHLVHKSPILSPLFNRYTRLFKRVFDILISGLMIVLILSWLTPLLVLLIRLDSKGPVFFRQKRNRNHGLIFNCLKFRTMVVNADADVLSAIENDERITRIGVFLRKHHLDELPQLINVFMGDMSMIGPRPHMICENEKFQQLFDEYLVRHCILPGITGLAQSYGNFGATDDLEKVRERTRLDLLYIRKWSFLMDIKILVRTGRLIFRA